MTFVKLDNALNVYVCVQHIACVRTNNMAPGCIVTTIDGCHYASNESVEEFLDRVIKLKGGAS